MLFLLMDMADTPEKRIKVEELYDEYDKLLYYVAGKILTQKEDIEDAIMDAWIKIIQIFIRFLKLNVRKQKVFWLL